MNRTEVLFLCVLFATTLAYGQSETPASSQASPAPVGHGSFPVKLTKTIDSGKLKQGDAVEAETNGSFKLPDGTLVPKGSKLRGQVVAATARSKGDSQSKLTLAFDKLDIVNGKPLSVKGTVQAVFPPYEEPAPQMAGKASGAAGGGYTGPTIGSVTDSKSGSNMDSSSNPQAAMNPQATGVQGMHDLSLENGVLTSSGKQVKLAGGVRMIVHADIFQ